MMFFGDVSRDTSRIIRPDVSLEMSRNVAEKHYDSKHDKLTNSMNTIESTNTNIFKNIYAETSKVAREIFQKKRCVIN